MLLNYSKTEQKQLDNIDTELKGALDKAYEDFNKAESDFVFYSLTILTKTSPRSS